MPTAAQYLLDTNTISQIVENHCARNARVFGLVTQGVEGKVTSMMKTNPFRLALPLLVLAALFAANARCVAAETGRELYERIDVLRQQAAAESNKVAASGGGTWAIVAAGMTAQKEAESLEKQLHDQATAGDPSSAFYWGLLNGVTCRRFSSSDIEEVRKLAPTPCSEAIGGFTIASKAGVGEASWNIATMYAAGTGVVKSRLAAAEWYARAGGQFVQAGDRERALAALENAEAIDERLPDALGLRKLLFPPQPREGKRKR